MADFREEFCVRNVRLGVVVRFLENILHTCQVHSTWLTLSTQIYMWQSLILTSCLYTCCVTGLYWDAVPTGWICFLHILSLHLLLCCHYLPSLTHTYPVCTGSWLGTISHQLSGMCVTLYITNIYDSVIQYNVRWYVYMYLCCSYEWFIYEVSFLSCVVYKNMWKFQMWFLISNFDLVQIHYYSVSMCETGCTCMSVCVYIFIWISNNSILVSY